MTPLFVDTAYLVAVINPRDQLRSKAIAARQDLGQRRLLVTESVLVETLNYFAEFRQDLKLAEHRVVERLLLNPDVEVVEQSTAVFHDGMALYAARLDTGYSLTDCISMRVCKVNRVFEVLTNDDHFRQEGFSVLL